MLTGHPFDDLKAILQQLPEADSCAAKKLRKALETKPVMGNGGLSDLLVWLGKWQGKAAPSVAESHICILASSYEGEDKETVQAYIEATSKGAAAVNLLCVDKGIGLRAIQLAPEVPHIVGDGWEASDCMASVAFGMEATASGGDLLGLADMATGNAKYALAVLQAVLGEDRIASLGSDDEENDLLKSARELVSSSVCESVDALEAMRLFGGREIAASVGAIVAARSRRLPVIAEGWAALAAVAILEACQTGSTDHVWPSSFDTLLQRNLWTELGKSPLVGFPVETGPGCGVAIAVSHLAAACALLGLRDRKD